MRFLTVATQALLLASSTGSLQAGNVDGETLIKSCAELVVIYDRNGEKGLYASLSTSVAEAMRAGICRGMLEEHGRHNRHGCDNNWREQALLIAKYGSEDAGVEELLDMACEG